MSFNPTSHRDGTVTYWSAYRKACVSRFNPTYHRDGTVTYWSAYRKVCVSRSYGIAQ